MNEDQDTARQPDQPQELPIFMNEGPAIQPTGDGEGVRMVKVMRNMTTGERVFVGKGMVTKPHQGNQANMPIEFPIAVPEELQVDMVVALRYAFDHIEEAYEAARPDAEAFLAKQLSPGIIVPKPGGNGKGFDFRGGKGSPYNEKLMRRMRGR